MIVSHEREKLLNAIIFFVTNTKKCNTLKLLKLINFLDFEHFRQTGRSVTGLRYEAWEQGPVSRELWNEMKQPRDDFAQSVSVTVKHDELTDVPTRRDFEPRRQFEPKWFTRREMQIMQVLADFFQELSATDMSQFSHGSRMPWFKVFKGKNAPGQTIPYELALESDPIIKKMPTIEPEEYEYRREAFREVEEIKASNGR
jgi:uncharacterized phage-associated protein